MARQQGKKWQGKVGFSDQSGKVRSKTETFKTKKEALAWEAKIKAEKLAGKGLNEGKNMLVGEFLERWFDQTSPTWGSKGTVMNVRSQLDARILPRWADTKLSEVTVQKIESWYSSMANPKTAADGKPISGTTILRYHSTMHSAFETALRWELVEKNPFSKVRKPRKDTKEVVPPKMEEVLLLVQKGTEKDPVLGVALHLAAATGARRGEIVGLQWGDVDFETGTLRIQRNVIHIGNAKIDIKRPKNDDTRSIAVGEHTIALLAQHRDLCDMRAREVGSALVDSSFLFSESPSFSSPWKPDHYGNLYETVRKECRLEHVKLHAFRHYNTTRMIEQGADIVTIAGRLGHKNPRTTLAVYAHFIKAPDRKIANLLNEDFAN